MYQVTKLRCYTSVLCPTALLLTAVCYERIAEVLQEFWPSRETKLQEQLVQIMLWTYVMNENVTD
jgi:hypothetical protein